MRENPACIPPPFPFPSDKSECFQIALHVHWVRSGVPESNVVVDGGTISDLGEVSSYSTGEKYNRQSPEFISQAPRFYTMNVCG